MAQVAPDNAPRPSMGGSGQGQPPPPGGGGPSGQNLLKPGGSGGTVVSERRASNLALTMGPTGPTGMTADGKSKGEFGGYVDVEFQLNLYL